MLRTVPTKRFLISKMVRFVQIPKHSIHSPPLFLTRGGRCLRGDGSVGRTGCCCCTLLVAAVAGGEFHLSAEDSLREGQDGRRRPAGSLWSLVGHGPQVGAHVVLQSIVAFRCSLNDLLRGAFYLGSENVGRLSYERQDAFRDGLVVDEDGGFADLQFHVPFPTRPAQMIVPLPKLKGAMASFLTLERSPVPSAFGICVGYLSTVWSRCAVREMMQKVREIKSP